MFKSKKPETPFEQITFEKSGKWKVEKQRTIGKDCKLCAVDSVGDET